MIYVNILESNIQNIFGVICNLKNFKVAMWIAAELIILVIIFQT